METAALWESVFFRLILLYFFAFSGAIRRQSDGQVRQRALAISTGELVSANCILKVRAEHNMDKCSKSAYFESAPTRCFCSGPGLDHQRHRRARDPIPPIARSGRGAS